MLYTLYHKQHTSFSAAIAWQGITAGIAATQACALLLLLLLLLCCSS
jgi:hypothetical protein